MAIKQEHRTVKGEPAGGTTFGKGLKIYWQDGPVGPGGPNGAFLEDVIEAAIGRLEYYQQGKYASDYNAEMLMHLREAMNVQQRRMQERRESGKEGTTEA